ncbi:oligosaccharide flippase family protein [Phycicoccus endophyticus]|uniref:Oligosaccharide flippase family protein n=1 Tax=Phycicoccus endophyticus TaxID=1690220 RepID=A0A7G9R2T9_9MICO|nr:oligosaccharide flippase family protein [Phycicoccus endophyticus]NHI20384.1 oligosaccharide flippase family protein [Phycicoccus endophyticus]QNN49914.1 oligosaccharide flippase family protein [Phycicoccus endophyticus]GGL29651.1 polysaccharide biosynthesis protein [Phycicoccus endophyticus]
MLTLMTGTAMAQAIPVAISPILTRLYEPSQMGLLALFVALTAIPAAIASGRYELAIQLADDDDDAINVAALSLIIAGTVAAMLLAVVVVAGGPIAHLVGNSGIQPWLYLVPLSVLLTTTFTVLTYLNTRAKQFKDLATSNVFKSAVMAVLQMGAGALKLDAVGLIVGHIGSLVAGNGRLSRNAARGRNLRAIVSRDRMKLLAKRYARMSAFLTPSTLANTLANNLSSVLIASFYSTATLGFYSLAQRALGAPLQLLGNAIGQVFFQRASEAKRAKGSAYPEMRKARNALLASSVIIFVPLYFVVEPLFAFVFGEPWRTTGTYAQFLIPMIAARFAASPLVLMNHVNERHGAHFLFNLALLGTTILVIVGGGHLGFPPERMFLILGLANAALYLGFMMYVGMAARRSDLAAPAR